jgi:hypothetical protein
MATALGVSPGFVRWHWITDDTAVLPWEGTGSARAGGDELQVITMRTLHTFPLFCRCGDDLKYVANRERDRLWVLSSEIV